MASVHIVGEISGAVSPVPIRPMPAARPTACELPAPRSLTSYTLGPGAGYGEGLVAKHVLSDLCAAIGADRGY